MLLYSPSFGRRPSQLFSFVPILALLFASTRARAGAADDAKRHFTNGIHLFEDRNFAGALVEFEASFQSNPTAVALQNIAVCQKGLFRYADAIATLERMLREFGAQLSSDDKRAAEDAMRDMRALLGTMVVRVTPEGARITINGAPLSAEDRQKPVPLAAGEYRVVADAQGYARQERMVTVVSGQNTEFEAKLSAEDAVSADKAPVSGPPPYVAPSQRGLYGFLTFGGDLMNTSPPEGVTNNKARSGGGFGSLRVGYRFTTALAVEFLTESATHDFDAYDTKTPATTGQYTFTSTRIGPALRLMTNGAKGRFVATVGLGAAVHGIAYKKALAAGRSDQSAAGSFLQLTGGYELSLGHFLVDAGLHLTAETADQQKVGIKNATSAGLEFRVGYGTW